MSETDTVIHVIINYCRGCFGFIFTLFRCFQYFFQIFIAAVITIFTLTVKKVIKDSFKHLGHSLIQN
jgi:hypothetical protein